MRAAAPGLERILGEENLIPGNWITNRKEIPWPCFEWEGFCGNTCRIDSINSRQQLLAK